MVGCISFGYPKIEIRGSQIPSFSNLLKKIGYAQKNIICTALKAQLSE